MEKSSVAIAITGSMIALIGSLVSWWRARRAKAEMEAEMETRQEEAHSAYRRALVVRQGERWHGYPSSES